MKSFPLRATAAVFIAIVSLTANTASTDNAQKNRRDYKVGERLASANAPSASKTQYKTVRWDDLLAPGWQPEKLYASLNLDKLNDNDPRAMDAMEKIQEAWKKAPVNPGMKGSAIRIAGFFVPLDENKDGVREFLLVPYFGACIHVPPPPANQIIHVFLDKPHKNLRVMDTIWVSGTLDTVRAETYMGDSGYRLHAQGIEPYIEQPKP